MNTRPDLVMSEPATRALHLTCSQTMIQQGTAEAPLPGDHQIALRAMLLAAIGTEPVRMSGVERNSKLAPTIGALVRLGAMIDSDGDDVLVSGLRSAEKERVHTLNLGSSIDGARLLLGVLAGLGIPAVVDGDRFLREESMDGVVNPLLQMGARIEYLLKPGRLPVRNFSRHLRAGDVRIPAGDLHARDAVLLAACAAELAVRIFQPAHSNDHTVRLLRSIGAALVEEDLCVTFRPGHLQRYHTHPLPVDSTLASHLVAAHVLQKRTSEMRIERMGLNPKRIGFLECLRSAGIRLRFEDMSEVHGEPVGTLVIAEGRQRLDPLVIRTQAQLHAMLDELPLAAVVASQVDGVSEFPYAHNHGLSYLTAAMDASCALIRAFGRETQASSGMLRITGSSAVMPSTFTSPNDPRFAMAAAVVGCAGPSTIRILHGGCHASAYPSFVNAMRWYGFDVSHDDLGGEP